MTDKQDTFGIPLFTAIVRGDIDAIRLYLSMGGDPHFRDRHQTLLIIAALQAKPEIVELLLATGARANDVDDVGGSALHYAAWNGDVQSMGLLLAAGASPHLLDVHGNTALQRALLSPLKNARLPMVKLLMAHGADPDLSGPGRRTPRSLARDVLRELESLAVIEQFKKA